MAVMLSFVPSLAGCSRRRFREFGVRFGADFPIISPRAVISIQGLGEGGHARRPLAFAEAFIHPLNPHIDVAFGE